jgi:hypothetical protein
MRIRHRPLSRNFRRADSNSSSGDRTYSKDVKHDEIKGTLNVDQPALQDWNFVTGHCIRLDEGINANQVLEATFCELTQKRAVAATNIQHRLPSPKTSRLHNGQQRRTMPGLYKFQELTQWAPSPRRNPIHDPRPLGSSFG